MKTLHVLRSKPDAMVRLLIDEMRAGDDCREIPLHAGAVDYDRLVEAVFQSDRVISWW